MVVIFMESKNYKKIQYFLSMILTFFMVVVLTFKTDFIINLKPVLLYIPFVIWIAIIVLFIFETKFKTGFIRMFYLIVTTGLSLLIISNLEEACAAVMLFNLGYLILMIFAFSSKTKDKDRKEKNLPIGQFSQKHHVLQTLTLIGIFILAIITIYIFEYLLNLDIFVSMLLSFIIIFVFIIYLNQHTNPLVKALNVINKEINFTEYEKRILELLNGTNLHEDSKSYLMLFYVNYLYLYDLDKAINLFNDIRIPEHKIYKLNYYTIDIINSINKKDKVEAFNKIESFRKLYPNHKYICKFERSFTVSLTLDEIPNIKELHPIDKGLNIQRLINAEVLMHYYNSRNNISEAKKYAEYVVEHGNDLLYLVNKAKEIIDSSNL